MVAQRLAEVEITFRSNAEGGRAYSDGMLEGFRFRPGLVQGDPSQSTAVVDASGHYTEIAHGVAFIAGPHHIEPNQKLRATFSIIGWPSPYCEWMQPGATFTMREGPKIIGSGQIIKVWTQDAT